ncbi:MAG TPA: hypothetical protein VKV02_07020, partial [Acidobacteriaceae bacterium]|nr:hypothetical protein [Acidobacteriaceae bacterium]
MLALLATFVTGCGSGSSGSQPSPTPIPTPDFALTLSTASLTLTPGTPSTFQVSLQPINAFSGTATVQISGLPSGVTLTPGASFSISGSSAQTVTVSAASTVTPASYSLQITASSGSVIHSQTEVLTVQAPAKPDFALSLSTPSLQLGSGTSATFQIALQPSGGFSGGAQVQITGVPAGATVSPSGPFVVYSSEPQTVTVATANALNMGSYTLSIAATAGSLSHTANETLTVANFGALPSRADFVRTDDTPGSAVYDQAHQAVYVSDPIAGTVDVISSVTYQLLRRIPVPSPAGLDISPDNTTVFVGSSTQVVYALDTATMAMTARYVVPLNQQSASVILTQPPLAPVAAPDGTALISANGSILKWNPSTGQTSTVSPNAPVGFQYGAAMGPMGRSAGHTKVILSNNLSTSTVYVYDETKGTFSSPLTFNGYAPAVAVNPAGTQFAVAWVQGSTPYISFFDTNLNPITTIQGGGQLLYSHDGSTLYVSSLFGQMPLIETLNTSSFKFTGTAPLYASSVGNRAPPLSVATPLATDETGRVFGSADHGLSIDDATDLRAYTGTEVYPVYDLSAVPDAGPVGQQQTVQIETESYPSAPALWFGSFAGSTSLTNGPLAAIAPASTQPGPVNLRFEDTDKVQAWIPQGYTYGSVLSSGPDIAGPQSGNSTVSLWGYGLGNNAGAPGTGSSGVTVSFGGVSGTLLSDTTYTGTGGYPFPLWALTAGTPQ